MATVTLNIDGMTCGGCVKSVTKVLNGLDGVRSATVSLENKNAQVEFDEGKIQIAQLVEAVEDAGFDACAA
ncbi:putative mercuric reductase [Kingella denitrificans]|uniref:Heavy metal-associated domain protein n=1 Tax=Kingella denitrificans ATCC 33394 TaxID=888741 RepID=F0F2E6_9NEIS|nr:cation transporter [Kingella denitrificans]EGC16253.1 heavy metal-associated domain protein [Kingella denitrificans ATCC 33394]QQB42648.1 heavy-metal-associated domain-containing protein [Kingella denitrificans]STR11399.1 putative mercuric reductase [Kingella denitrificans]